MTIKRSEQRKKTQGDTELLQRDSLMAMKRHKTSTQRNLTTMKGLKMTTKIPRLEGYTKPLKLDLKEPRKYIKGCVQTKKGARGDLVIHPW